MIKMSNSFWPMLSLSWEYLQGEAGDFASEFHPTMGAVMVKKIGSECLSPLKV